MFAWTKHEVCLVEGPKDTYVLIGIRPERHKNTGGNGETVIWDDGSHQRAFPVGKALEDDSALFRFEDQRGQQFSLRPMTKKLYDLHVRDVTGGPELKSDEAVRAFYLQPRPW